jgi:hypothetical protein
MELVETPQATYLPPCCSAVASLARGCTCLERSSSLLGCISKTGVEGVVKQVAILMVLLSADVKICNNKEGKPSTMH